MSPTLAAAAAGLDASLHEAMHSEAPRLSSLARRMMGNEADAADVLQDAWVRAWSNRDAFRGEGVPAAWLRAIVVRECLRSLRWRGVRRWLPFSNHDEESEELPDPRSGAEALLAARRVRRVVESLPAQQRLVVGLRYDEGWTTGEIAIALELSPETVKTHLSRGIERVRQHMGVSDVR